VPSNGFESILKALNPEEVHGGESKLMLDSSTVVVVVVHSS
jgi:hypothetical protein